MEMVMRRTRSYEGGQAGAMAPVNRQDCGTLTWLFWSLSQVEVMLGHHQPPSRTTHRVKDEIFREV